MRSITSFAILILTSLILINSIVTASIIDRTFDFWSATSKKLAQVKESDLWPSTSERLAQGKDFGSDPSKPLATQSPNDVNGAVNEDDTEAEINGRSGQQNSQTVPPPTAPPKSTTPPSQPKHKTTSSSPEPRQPKPTPFSQVDQTFDIPAQNFVFAGLGVAGLTILFTELLLRCCPSRKTANQQYQLLPSGSLRVTDPWPQQPPAALPTVPVQQQHQQHQQEKESNQIEPSSITQNQLPRAHIEPMQPQETTQTSGASSQHIQTSQLQNYTTPLKSTPSQSTHHPRSQLLPAPHYPLQPILSPPFYPQLYPPPHYPLHTPALPDQTINKFKIIAIVFTILISSFFVNGLIRHFHTVVARDELTILNSAHSVPSYCESGNFQPEGLNWFRWALKPLVDYPSHCVDVEVRHQSLQSRDLLQILISYCGSLLTASVEMLRNPMLAFFQINSLWDIASFTTMAVFGGVSLFATTLAVWCICGPSSQGGWITRQCPCLCCCFQSRTDNCCSRCCYQSYELCFYCISRNCCCIDDDLAKKIFTVDHQYANTPTPTPSFPLSSYQPPTHLEYNPYYPTLPHYPPQSTHLIPHGSPGPFPHAYDPSSSSIAQYNLPPYLQYPLQPNTYPPMHPHLQPQQTQYPFNPQFHPHYAAMMMYYHHLTMQQFNPSQNHLYPQPNLNPFFQPQYQTPPLHPAQPAPPYPPPFQPIFPSDTTHSSPQQQAQPSTKPPAQRPPSTTFNLDDVETPTPPQHLSSDGSAQSTQATTPPPTSATIPPNQASSHQTASNHTHDLGSQPQQADSAPSQAHQGRSNSTDVPTPEPVQQPTQSETAVQHPEYD